MDIWLRKYRRVLIPLVLALIFDLCLLAINYRLALELQASAAFINITGRQRMLSQRITKTVAVVYYLHSTGQSTLGATDEMRASVMLFQQTLQALANGGPATSASGEAIVLAPISMPVARATLDSAVNLWQQFYAQLNQTLLSNSYDQQQLGGVLETLVKDNVRMLAMMNDLTIMLERDAAQKTWLLRIIQALIVVLVLVLFFLSLLRLKKAENYYSSLMESTSDIVFSVNVSSGLVTFMSQSVESILGLGPDHFVDRKVDQLFTDKSAQVFNRLLKEIDDGAKLPRERLEFQLLRSDSCLLVMDSVIKESLDERGRSVELHVDLRDITERKQYEMKLIAMAHRDPLTGLPNRNLFFDFAEQAICRAARQQNSMAILFIDLDGFKSINDRFGHESGDKLLCNVARKLSDCVRQSDTVCRLGGDEFVVLVEQVKTRQSLLPLCEKIVTSLSLEQIIGGTSCAIGVSMGVALYPEDGSRVAELINRADEAMYAIKHSGKGDFGFATATKPAK